jgi:hypothetical protein
MTLTRRVGAGVGIAFIVAALSLALPPVRRHALQAAGGFLILGDPVTAVDIITIAPESEQAGILYASDLYRQGIAPAVLVLLREPPLHETELRRRGVPLPTLAELLVGLGVPRGSISERPAGEGGTTDSTATLRDWAREHQQKKMLVIVGATHSRRYRRALARVWPDGQPVPAVVVTPYGLFRRENWWQSRRTLRDGLVELEKLGLDYLWHPF